MKNNKVILGIVGAIIVIGIIMILTIGLNVSLQYRQNQRIQIMIGQTFDKEDIKDMAREVFPNEEISVSYVEDFKDMVSIMVNQTTEEQVEQIKDAVNEKYGLELTMDDILVTSTPNYRIRDMVKPYIAPVIVSVILIGIYFMILYRKKGVIRVKLTYLITVIIVELLFVSVLAITRLPVNELTMPIALTLIIISTLFTAWKLNKQ